MTCWRQDVSPAGLTWVWMHPAIEPAPFLVDAGDVPDFQTALCEISSSGYTETAVRERLNLTDITDLKWKALPIYRAERLAERDAQALAMELFMLQGAVPEGELKRLFSVPSQAVLLRTGILEIDSSGTARARNVPPQEAPEHPIPYIDRARHGLAFARWRAQASGCRCQRT